MTRSIKLLTSALTIAILSASSASADTLLVPDTYSTIQAAIDAAVDGDVVVVADGTFTGSGNRDLDFGGRAITVRSENGAGGCIIDIQADSGDPHRGCHFHNGETDASVMDGFTIRNGFMNKGGAVLCENGSSPLFQSCVFQQNTASAIDTGNGGGGAVFSDGSDPTFNDCDFLENEARTNGFQGVGGGAIRSVTGSGVTLNSCQFVNNESGVVGAIASVNADTTLSANNCDFIGNTANTAYFGIGIIGAVVVGNNSSGTFTGCRFLNNTATGAAAGAVYVSGGTATAEFTDCLFAGNSAEFGAGGAVAVQNGDPHGTFTNCLFADNLAASGGGLWIDDGTATVTNCTFSENTANNQAGALRVKDLATVDVHNSILWGNSPDQISVENGGVLSMSYSDIEGSWPGTGNIIEDPLFVDPDGADDNPDTWQDNNYRIAATSPCIDAADNTVVPRGIETDLDGHQRFVDDPDTKDNGVGGPPTVDMGAYEFQTCPTDLNADDTVDAADLAILLGNWGPVPPGSPVADLNHDGMVDAVDLAILLGNWGPCE